MEGDARSCALRVAFARRPRSAAVIRGGRPSPRPGTLAHVAWRWQMFTGLVEGQGVVESLDHRPAGDGARLRVATGWPAGALALGDSVAVNGCCVTVAELGDGWFAADMVAETLRRTALGRLEPGD